MSDNQLTVEVVRGEMQPWSDFAGKRGAVRGPVLRALLDDVLPSGARTLVLGPHGVDLIEVIVAKASQTTMLVRSVSDAGALAEHFGDELQVIAGALDGLEPAAFEVVVAVDGLDRVLGYDSDDLDWAARLTALAGVAAPSAVLLLGLENEFSLTNLLDRRPPDQRHGDDEWRPLHDDPSRPVSAEQFTAALSAAGFADATTYASFSVLEASVALLGTEVAAAARPGELPTRVAVESLETSAAAVPLLAPISEAANTAARAGLLASTAPSWLAVTTPTSHAIYAQAGPAVLIADDAPNGWSLTTRPAPADDVTVPDSLAPAATATGEAAAATVQNGAGRTGAADGASTSFDDASTAAASAATAAGVVFDLGVVPEVVPGGVTVETVLLRLAAAEDVPGFRQMAGRLGNWARAQAQDSRALLRWDDVVVDGDGFSRGFSPWAAAADETVVDLLAAAWQRFHDRLIGGHHRHPWPPWMVGDDLVSTWLSMSGVDAPPPVVATSPETPSPAVAQVARGKELAAGLAVALGIPADASQTPDVRTALAEVERAQQEVFELKGHIFGLERTLGFRDKALKTRENRLRELRLQIQKVNAERAKLRSSRAYVAVTLVRKAAMIRKPRKFAGKVKRALRNRLG